MHILIFLFLSISCLIYYGNAAGNSNQVELAMNDFLREITIRQKKEVGGETEQDPNDPKYQKMAKTLVLYHLLIKEEDIKNIKVNRVTTQVVAGIITRIEIKITLHSGISNTCNFEVWERSWENVKYVTFECLVQKKVLTGISNKPRPEQTRDPKAPKYQKLTKASIDSLFQTAGNKPFKKEDISKITVTKVKVQIGSKIMNYITFNVITVNNNNYQCTSIISEKPWDPQETAKVSVVTCELAKRNGKLLLRSSSSKLNLPGGEVNGDPNNPKYQSLAKISFQRYLDTHGDINVQVKSIKIDSVTTQVVAGMITRIQFDVYPTRGSRFNCRSKIFEKLGSARNLEFDVKCDRMYGGEEKQDPDDPQYQQLAKESFRKYRETHIGPLFAIKEQRVTRATTQVVAGLITRLDFYVTTTEGGKYTCHSDIYEQRWKKIKKIDVNCYFVGTGGNAKLAVKLNSNSKRDNFATEVVKRYLEDEYEMLSLKLAHSEVFTRSIKILTTRVSKQKITYYKVDAFAHVPNGDNSMYNCSVLAGSWFGRKPIATNCIKVNYLMGGSMWVDPTNKKYLSFAEKSLQFYLKYLKNVGPREYRKYDVIVTFVKRGSAKGYGDNINFVARWVHSNDDEVLICNTEIWEKLDGKPDIPKAECAKVSWNRHGS